MSTEPHLELENAPKDIARPDVAASTGQPHAEKTSGFAQSAAHWIHEHPKATSNPFGYTVYQGLRGAAAGVPYGISMAGTLGAMVGLERLGASMAKGAEHSVGANFGRRLEQFAKFPAVRSSAMIATSFTLYRGTSKLGKFVHDQLFDPKDTEQQTAEKIQHMPSMVWNKAKENAPAGLASTPVAAFVLGFVTSTFQKPAADKLKDAAGHSLDWTHANYKLAKAEGRSGPLLKDVIKHPNAKFVEQAAINTLGYSLFFELGDRLFKDRQIARGKWPGDDHSIKPAKAVVDANGVQPIATQGEPAPEKKYGFFTDEPSVGRFVFRRMLPTAASITAYTAFKFRHAYMKLGDLAVKAEKPILPQIPKLAGIETTAVLWFAMIPFVAEKWEKWYDGFFDKLEHKQNPNYNSPITPTLASAVPNTHVGHLPVSTKIHEIPTVQVAQVDPQGKTQAPAASVAV